MLNATEHEISSAQKKKTKISKKIFLAFKLSDIVLILLINVKMPTFVGILTFMSMVNCWHFNIISRINFMPY